MLGLLAILEQLTAALRCISGDDLALYRLRVWYAAKLILENPGLLPFDRGDFDGDLVAPAEEGERLAQTLRDAGEQVAIVETSWVRDHEIANVPLERIGPFWTATMEQVGFDILQSRPAEWVTLARSNFLPGQSHALLVLPGTSALAADGRSIDVPAGTIWIAAALLAPGNPNFVGLRVAGATIKLNVAIQPIAAGERWILPPTGRFSLVLAPEQPAAGNANGVLALPQRLEIAFDGTVTVTGSAQLSSAGGALDFAPGGAPVAQAGGILLPLQVAGGEFVSDALDPVVLRWRGRHSVVAAGWLLPFAEGDAVSGEAADGGLIELELTGGGGTSAEWTDGSASLGWPQCRLRLASERASCVTQAAEGGGAVEFALWAGATSRFRIGKGRKNMRLAWNSAGEASFALQSGTLACDWDLPRTADDRTLPLSERNAAAIAMVRTADGDWVTTLDAFVDPDAMVQLPIRGLALPNLFLPVQGPRRLAAGGRGERPSAIPAGQAWLKLDARMAEPMLPDPYAASWAQQRNDERVESALDVLVRWTAAAKPVVQVALAAAPPWPGPLLASSGGSRADGRFRSKLATHQAPLHDRDFVLRLLDLSSHAQQFGIEIDRLLLANGHVAESLRLSLPASGARLFLLPQVHWESVRNLTPPGVIDNASQGMPAFAGAIDSELVELLPEPVALRVVAAAHDGKPAAALFSLPFGLRAFADFGPDDDPESLVPPTAVALHRPAFERKLVAATQLRLEARERMIPGRQPLGETRMMAGTLSTVVPAPGKQHVLADIASMIEDSFDQGVPVHRLDLSGYGLSCFSLWRQDPDPKQDFVGVTEVRFDVLIGRTSYEVIEVRSYLMHCQCRVVRTIILDRSNAGIVERYDSGWKPIEDGLFNRYVPFDTGLVRRFSNIRNIRILDRPRVEFAVGGTAWQWEVVSYDADAHLGEPGAETIVPIRDHIGYIPLKPVVKPVKSPPAGAPPLPPPADQLTDKVLTQLFQLTGKAGGPADAQLMLGGTLPFHVTGIYADRAPRPGGADGFVVEVDGTPGLSRVGEWNSVRVAQDGQVSSVDAQRGIPVIRAPAASPYRFREAAAAFAPGDDFGFLMAIDGGRVLFPRPQIDPGAPGTMRTAPPEFADAYALSQANGWMPARARRLLCNEPAEFRLPEPGNWQLDTDFTLGLTDPALAGATKWQLSRGLEGSKTLKLLLDGGAAAPAPLSLARGGADALALDLPGLPAPLMTLTGNFMAELGKATRSEKPGVRFGDALEQLKEIVDALRDITGISLPFDIDVNAVPGPTPAFEVRLNLELRIPPKENERIEIGIGKFCGRFGVTGTLRAALGGPAQGQLQLAFEGDLQQGIIPPLLYGGGFFRFAITISNSDDPRVELGFAVTASIGGDLIPGLVSLEVTVRYGYLLVPTDLPKALEAGILLGLEARAKLLSGLVGLSFGTDVMARVRLDVLPDSGRSFTIFAEIRVVATLEVLWGLDEEETELHTQFKQAIPFPKAIDNAIDSAVELL